MSTDTRHNLPARLNSFIGREREMAEIARLLDTARLLTLSGAPGVGKSRLSLEVAESLLDRFPAGVRLIELAPVADPGLVPQAIAAALGVREQPGRALPDTLADVLHPQRVLLVLDNCEHMVDACAGLADELLRACPDLTILATSREPLGIAGETAWRVPSLSLPDGDGAPGGETRDAWAFDAHEAVRLFVERAQAARPDFALTASNAPAVIRICRRLDGIPLALELAGARVTGLSVAQIADRLDDRFRLLTSGSRTARPRQRTLRATLDWSYDLLVDAERALLRRLAVFAGGWTLEAAEAVCAWDRIEPPDVLDLLQHLVDKSLVVADARQSGATRYRMLEMLQQYAHEKLAERGEADDARRQHAAWFLELAEDAEIELRGPHERAWMDRLEADIDNLRATLRWVIDRGEAERALRLASALWRFWTQRGHLVEGLDWLEQVLALGSGSGDASVALLGARAGALNGAGNLAAVRGEHARAASFLAESLALRRRLGDTAGEAIALLNLGTAARNLGDPDLAYARFSESLGLFRSLGHTLNTATSLFNLGRLRHDEGDLERAAALYGESLALFQAVGSDRGVAILMIRLGDMARDRGDLAAAERLLGDALVLLRGRGDPWILGQILTGLARVAAGRHDHARTTTLACQSLRALHAAGASRDTATALAVLAVAACVTGQAELGGQLLGAVDRAYPEGSAIRAEQAGFEQAVAAAREVLGEAAFAAFWADGHALSLDQAVDLALTTFGPAPLADAVPPGSMAGPPPATEPVRPPAAPAPSPSALTRREREVAALIARGMTNREIADELVISEMTADSHVSHILRKLGFRSRAQVAAWAVGQGLEPPSR